jgi:glutamine synthetase
MLEAFTRLMKVSEPVLFEGDCYSREWRVESERRGLPHAAATAAALEAFVDEDNQAFLERLGIWSRNEASAFYRAKLEEYAKQVAIEARTMLEMVGTGIEPAALTHQTHLARRAEALGAARALAEARADKRAGALASQLSRALDGLADFGEKLDRLADRAAALRAESDALEETDGEAARGRHSAAKVVPAMAALRESCDEVEAALPAWLYPFPTCGDLLTSGG